MARSQPTGSRCGTSGGIAVNWNDGSIPDCSIRPLNQFGDARGWLTELFRQDEMPLEHHPVMAYLSLTLPGAARGPHEHRQQADLFVFFDGAFRLYLWDARAGSATYGWRQVEDVGADRPCAVVVPAGIIHAYRNCGARRAIMINCPNQLYRGEGRSEPVDEIRHEDGSPYILNMD